MKKTVKGVLAILSATILSATGVSAQTIGNEAFPQLNGGFLDFNIGGQGQKIRLGGYLQAKGYYRDIKDENSEQGFDVGHAMVSLEGSFLRNKVGFFLQADFAESYPLSDAWISFTPWRQLRITAGQKQTFTNSSQMLMLEQGLAFGERSMMDRSFSRSGRELGLFVESRLPVGKTGFDLGVAVTTGDGRNSFGSNSTDTDKGGLKYGGRVSFYPLGFFANGNERVFTDFVREKTPKLAIGGAYSYNDGTSNAVGEGHSDFAMYDKDGKEKLPDYQKISADILLKWNGFSFLAEYTNAVGAGLKGLYTEANGKTMLQPRQIADYLAIGNGYNFQTGYITPSAWAFDVAYSKVKPEWKETEASVLKDCDNVMVGVSKFFLRNNLKLQLAGSYTDYSKMSGAGSRSMEVMLNVHLVL